MASANITKATAAEFCKKYGIVFVETPEGGKVTVGADSKEFKYTAAGKVPPRTGLVSWLGERVPAVAKDFPVVKGKGKGGKGKVTVEMLTSDEFYADFTDEQIEDIKEHLDSLIPARQEAAKAKEREDLKAKLAALGLDTPKAVFEFIKDEAAAKAPKPAEIVPPEGKGKGKDAAKD